ncbi:MULTISPECIES: hypothetical protein [unclassified Rickettsia]
MKTGIQTFLCHAELVSASIEKDPEINSGWLKSIFLDSRFHGNDIEGR